MPTTRLILATAVIPVLLAGCGGGSSPKTATGGSGGRSGASAAYRFSSCMRAHGVANFPDPKVISSPGHESVGITVNPSITGSPNFKSAQQACQGIMGDPGNGNSQQQAAEAQAKARHLVAFARCMRTHRISDFPDPTAQGQITPPMLTAAGVDLKSPAVQQAAFACVPSAGGAVTAAQLHQAFTGGH